MYRITQLALIPTITLFSMSAIADITSRNGASIDMTGSTGSTIIFPNGSSLSEAPQDGVDGIDGINGSDGVQGPEGPEGPQGPQGIQGEQGIQGDPGDDLYDHVVVVRSGGTAAGNGSALKNTLVGITDASATKPL